MASNTRIRQMTFSAFKSSGCYVYYDTRDKIISVDGWCDHYTHMEGAEVTLKEFLEGLGITLEDVKSVLED